MATYAIGDVQGCATTLARLVDAIGFDPHADRLWFAGDLVNRGPGSLEVLRWVEGLGDRAVVVLGNHDLKLLAQAEGLWPTKSLDTLEPVLGAPDRERLVEWLSSRPLVHSEDAWLMSHAGAYPCWGRDELLDLASEASAALRQRETRREALRVLREERPARWDPAFAGARRIAAILVGLTRLRTVRGPSEACDEFSGPPADAPPGCTPWFDVPERGTRSARFVFGHWSSLGLLVRPDVTCLDTGCVWGRELTAYRLEDGAITQVPSAEPPRDDASSEGSD